MKTIKFILFAALFCLPLCSVRAQQTDYKLQNLKGKVRSLKYTSYVLNFDGKDTIRRVNGGGENFRLRFDRKGNTLFSYRRHTTRSGGVNREYIYDKEGQLNRIMVQDENGVEYRRFVYEWSGKTKYTCFSYNYDELYQKRVYQGKEKNNTLTVYDAEGQLLSTEQTRTSRDETITQTYNREGELQSTRTIRMRKGRPVEIIEENSEDNQYSSYHLEYNKNGDVVENVVRMTRTGEIALGITYVYKEWDEHGNWTLRESYSYRSDKLSEIHKREIEYFE